MQDEILFKAIEFATRAHRGQFRKGTRIPYVLHPLRTAQILIETDAAADLILAAILHDTIEDTDVTFEELEAEFGARVAQLVGAVSEPDRQAGWEDRKQQTIDSLRTASSEVLLVACADKLDNVRSMRRGERRMGPAFWERFHRPKQAQAWYYRRVSIAISESADSQPLKGLAHRLAREVDTLFGGAG